MRKNKKISLILAIAMIIALLPIYSVSAVNIGDKLGNVLNTDIKAFINDNRIPSYNINNKTVVIVEDLKNYGFDVVWNEQTRSSMITLNTSKKATPLYAEDNTKAPGSPAFAYLYTDIVAYVNNKRVETYNVQGKAAIFFESLGEYGTMKWDSVNRHSMLYTNSGTPTSGVGSKLGDVLNSNIKAFINDSRIPSYNIGNKTVIVAGDLANYGFDVVWNEAARTVHVTLNPGKSVSPVQAEDNNQIPGTPAFEYVYTDIVAYVNGKKVDSFNIKGKTVIYFASLSEYGIMKWDGANNHSKLYTLFNIKGRAYDSGTSSSLSGVQVRLKNKSGSTVATIKTQSDGTYSFANIPLGEYTAEFTLDGYKSHTSKLNISKGDITGHNASLAREGVTVSGKVSESSSGKALRNVTVNLRDKSGVIVATTTTGTDGSYSIDNVTAGSYIVEAVLKGYRNATTSQFNVSYSNVLNKNLSLAYEKSTISGYVYSYENNTVLQGATVNLKNSSGTTIATTTTSSTGAYSFTDVETGTYTIEAIMTGYAASYTSSFSVSYEDISGKNLSIRTSGYTVSGVIYDSSTSSVGISGATVTLKNSSGTVIATVTSQYGGTYTFKGLEYGLYTIEASVSGYSNKGTTGSFYVSENTTTKNIYLNTTSSTGNSISGTIYSYTPGSSILIYTSQGTYYTFAITSSTQNNCYSTSIGSTVYITYSGTLNSGSYPVVLYMDNVGTSSQQQTVSGTILSITSDYIIINTSSYGVLGFTINHISNKPSHLTVNGTVTITYTGYISYGNATNAVVTALY